MKTYVSSRIFPSSEWVNGLTCKHEGISLLTYLFWLAFDLSLLSRAKSLCSQNIPEFRMWAFGEFLPWSFLLQNNSLTGDKSHWWCWHQQLVLNWFPFQKCFFDSALFLARCSLALLYFPFSRKDVIKLGGLAWIPFPGAPKVSLPNQSCHR